MKEYRWLLFDADRTLFDFDHSEVIAIEQSIQQLGYSYHDEYLNEYRRVNEQVWIEFEQGNLTQEELKIKRFEGFLEAIQLSASSEELSQRYLENLAQGTELLEGAEKLIREVSKNYRLIIITNGLKEVQRSRLEQSTINGYFEALIVSDEIGVAKPEAEIFDAAFAAMGNPKKEDTLMIGDSWGSDMVGGINYGIDTCWFNPSRKERPSDLASTYEIRQLEELKAILSV